MGCCRMCWGRTRNWRYAVVDPENVPQHTLQAASSLVGHHGDLARSVAVTFDC